jgi:hypothetical protein
MASRMLNKRFSSRSARRHQFSEELDAAMEILLQGGSVAKEQQQKSIAANARRSSRDA